MDLYEELTCAGEKPFTTLVVLRSEMALASPEEADSPELRGDGSEGDSFFSSAVGMAICDFGSGDCSGCVIFGGICAR